MSRREKGAKGVRARGRNGGRGEVGGDRRASTQFTRKKRDGLLALGA